MVARGKKASARERESNWPDFHHTGPGTVAGRYMRLFWHPVHHSDQVPKGRAKPITVMNVDYTLFRGQDGRPYLVDGHCPHRGMQLGAGWVEGNCVRCFYHGWKFDGGSGQCVEQPAEPKPFAHKVRIGSYPCEDYLGMVFAYLGDGEVPPLPRYPDFEKVDGLFELDSYYRACNYFNNAENAADQTHSGFVHRNNPGSFDGFIDSPVMDAKESCWGITVFTRWPQQMRVTQLGMPNVLHHKAQPTDPTLISYREFLAWWVPVDDVSHIQFTAAALRMPADKVAQYVERRHARLATRGTEAARIELAERILRGELWLDDVDREATDFLRLQDDVAQVGQGRIANHRNERLGQSDKAVVLYRKVWARELNALASKRALKRWAYDRDQLDVSRGELWEKQSAAGVAAVPASAAV